MISLFIITLAISPAVLMAYLYYKKDSLNPEPLKKILKVYFVGWLTAFLVGAANSYAIKKFGFKFSVTFVGPAFEEIFKMVSFYYFVYYDKDFDEPIDGIIYSAVLALGFASLENITYLFSNYEILYRIAIIRGVTSVPAHAVFSVCWGYGLTKYKFDPKVSKSFISKMLIVSIVLHMIFNGTAVYSFFSPTLTIFVFIVNFIIMSHVVNVKIVKKTKEWNKLFVKKL